MTRITVSGVDNSFETRGKGPVLVLLHGWNSSRLAWSLNMRALSKGFRVIAPDLPGHGETAVPTDFGYSLEDHVAWLEGLRKALRLSDFGLVGFSLGGAIAAAYAASNPQRVRGLALCATPTNRKGLIGRNRMPGAELWLSLTHGLRMPWVLGFMMLRGVYKSEQLEKDFVQANVLEMRKISRETLKHTAYLARHLDIRPLLPLIAAPTLAIYGDKDHTVRMSEGRAIVEGISGARLLTLKDVAHCPPYERPDIFNAAVADFMMQAFERTGRDVKSP